jgi:hypothetical protein
VAVLHVEDAVDEQIILLLVALGVLVIDGDLDFVNQVAGEPLGPLLDLDVSLPRSEFDGNALFKDEQLFEFGCRREDVRQFLLALGEAVGEAGQQVDVEESPLDLVRYVVHDVVLEELLIFASQEEVHLVANVLVEVVQLLLL